MKKVFRLDMESNGLKHSFYFHDEEEANKFAGVMHQFFNKSVPEILKNKPHTEVTFSGQTCELIENKEDAKIQFDKMKATMETAANEIMSDLISKMKPTKSTDVN